MIQGLMMTPPVLGRIAIGKMVERNGKRLPEKDDEFTITTQVQNRAGWVLHPIDGLLRAQLVKPKGHADLSAAETAMQQVVQEPGAASRPSAKPTLQSKLSRRAKEQGASAVAAHAAADGSSGLGLIPIPLAEPNKALLPAPKLRSIPVRLLFNDPSLNLRASYTMFDRATARPICAGDGESCKRANQGLMESHPCPGPDHCTLGMDGNCKLFGRFHVCIDHPASPSDDCSTFVLRTTGVNTVRTLMVRMQYFQAVSGGLLAYLPLELRLRGKSTTQSRRAPIYYVDLCVREGMGLEAAVAQARKAAERAQRAGLDQAALDTAARKGYAQGLFEEAAEEVGEVLQEFYPRSEGGLAQGDVHGHSNDR
ncbi:phage capsid protein [Comamonas sediminis]|uniref:recombination directionality factor n=1 Tax=Comamonas sediminis TaxID=1783360 RepID=UPI003D29E825